MESSNELWQQNKKGRAFIAEHQKFTGIKDSIRDVNVKNLRQKLSKELKKQNRGKNKRSRMVTTSPGQVHLMQRGSDALPLNQVNNFMESLVLIQDLQKFINKVKFTRKSKVGQLNSEELFIQNIEGSKLNMRGYFNDILQEFCKAHPEISFNADEQKLTLPSGELFFNENGLQTFSAKASDLGEVLGVMNPSHGHNLINKGNIIINMQDFPRDAQSLSSAIGKSLKEQQSLERNQNAAFYSLQESRDRVNKLKNIAKEFTKKVSLHNYVDSGLFQDAAKMFETAEKNNLHNEYLQKVQANQEAKKAQQQAYDEKITRAEDKIVNDVNNGAVFVDFVKSDPKSYAKAVEAILFPNLYSTDQNGKELFPQKDRQFIRDYFASFPDILQTMSQQELMARIDVVRKITNISNMTSKDLKILVPIIIGKDNMLDNISKNLDHKIQGKTLDKFFKDNNLIVSLKDKLVFFGQLGFVKDVHDLKIMDKTIRRYYLNNTDKEFKLSDQLTLKGNLENYLAQEPDNLEKKIRLFILEGVMQQQADQDNISLSEIIDQQFYYKSKDFVTHLPPVSDFNSQDTIIEQLDQKFSSTETNKILSANPLIMVDDKIVSIANLAAQQVKEGSHQDMEEFLKQEHSNNLEMIIKKPQDFFPPQLYQNYFKKKIEQEHRKSQQSQQSHNIEPPSPALSPNSVGLSRSLSDSSLDSVINMLDSNLHKASIREHKKAKSNINLALSKSMSQKINSKNGRGASL